MQRVNQPLKIKSFQNLKLAHADCEFDLVIEQGLVHWLVGENGIGKSSFFHYLKEEKKQHPDWNIAFLDQFPLDPLVNMNVRGLLDMLTECSVLDQNWIEEIRLGESLPIGSFMETRVHDLSGGQNQLLKLFLCFGQNRDFYFIDEPFLNLDLNRSEMLQALINRVCDHHRGVLIIEHRESMMELFGHKKTFMMQYKTQDVVEISLC
jgi:translation initiation factor RLI1